MYENVLTYYEAGNSGFSSFLSSNLFMQDKLFHATTTLRVDNYREDVNKKPEQNLMRWLSNSMLD